LRWFGREEALLSPQHDSGQGKIGQTAFKPSRERNRWRVAGPGAPFSTRAARPPGGIFSVGRPHLASPCRAGKTTTSENCGGGSCLRRSGWTPGGIARRKPGVPCARGP